MELHVQKLSVARGGLAVLKDVSFSLSAGQALVIRGSQRDWQNHFVANPCWIAACIGR